MDHRQHLTDVIAMTLEEIKHLPQALAATEDAVLRSTPTDGGSRPIGAHSDPTPSAAMRRRRTDDRKTYDSAIRDVVNDLHRLRKLRVKVTEIPAKVGPCRTCVRTGQIITPPHGICVHCIKALDRARRRTPTGDTFDASGWVTGRHAELHTRATSTIQRG